MGSILGLPIFSLKHGGGGILVRGAIAYCGKGEEINFHESIVTAVNSNVDERVGRQPLDNTRHYTSSFGPRVSNN